ncbi:MAG: hypothetical protein Q8K36_00960, partial [Alphaproteobacteria bacterium]|nr:hypothetical protein [Alphaproteobacteria bacterium]
LSNMLYEASPILQKASVHYEAKDKDYDCVISFFHMDRVNDIAQYLLQMKQTLKPGGVFMAVFFGGSSFLNLKNLIMSYEIESISGTSLRVHPTIHIADAIHLLQQAGFACPVADGDNIHYTFETVYQLIQTLRSLGGTNQLITTPKPLDRCTARALLDNPKPFDEKFDYIYLTGLNPQTLTAQLSQSEDFSVSCQ